MSFSPGAVLVREGDPPEDAFAVLTGRVRVMTGDRLRMLASISAPGLVGEMAVVLNQPRNATAVATAPVHALRIPKLALLGAIAQEPQFAQELRAFAELRAATNFLRRDSPFADLPSDAIEELAAQLQAVGFAPGQILVREGEPGDDSYLLRSGLVQVVRGPAGAERHIAYMAAGSFVGEVSALTGAARTATVRATTPVRAFRLAGEDVRPVLRRYQVVKARLEFAMQSKHTPRRQGDVRVLPAPDDHECVILHEPKNGSYLRLSKQGLAIYEDLDGERSLRDVAIRDAERTGRDDPATVFAIVATLQAARLVTMPRIASDQPDARVVRLLDIVLAPRIELRDADPLATRLYHALRPLFGRGGTIVSLLIGALGIVALARTFREASASDFGVLGLVVAFAGLALAGIGHEAAHAIAMKAEGRRVGRAGIGLMMFTPVIWVDTSDAWFIPRMRRAVVNAAGPLFNFALAGALGLLATVTEGQAQNLAVWLAIANLVSVVVNLSPLLEFDGYYVLSDLANVNALRRKALRFAFVDLPLRRQWPLTRLEIGFVAYTAAATFYTLAVTLLVLTRVPALVSGILPPAVGGDTRVIASLGIGLLMAASLVLPYVSEIRASGTSADQRSAGLAEPLEERMSKTDLSAALSAKTSAPSLRVPFHTRR